MSDPSNRKSPPALESTGGRGKNEEILSVSEALVLRREKPLGFFEYKQRSVVATLAVRLLDDGSIWATVAYRVTVRGGNPGFERVFLALKIQDKLDELTNNGAISARVRTTYTSLRGILKEDSYSVHLGPEARREALAVRNWKGVR